MRALINIYILLFSFTLIIACTKEKKLEEVVYKIPIEDRCIFAEGDTLQYSCSNGSTDTGIVREVDFKTETGTYTPGGVPVHTFITETQRLIIEALHDNWKYENFDSQCFIIDSQPKYDDIYVENFPFCVLLNGCEYGGSAVLANKLADYDEIIFDGKTYKNVYFQSKGDLNNGFEIYWNLKYGIIRFVGISNGTKLIWQLQD